MKQSALGRLLGELRAPAHDYRPSTDVFPDLDVGRIAADLDLERKATERGERNEPPSTSASFDEIESQIVERVEAEKKRAHGVLEDELQTYEERLAGLDFEDSLVSIKEAARACIGEFRAEVARGLDTLHNLRKRLLEHETEREAFRRRHNLQRAPRVHSAGMVFLKVAILITLLIGETIINGIFLAKGNELGLLGGTTEAFAFAVLNVFGAFFLARVGVVELNHRSFFRKFLGLAALALYVILAVAISLALAHYREVSGTLTDTAGQEVLRRLLTAPHALSDINSWVFFGIGIACSLVAFIDGLVWSDPYPGYADVETRLRAASKAYTDTKEELIDELKAIRDEYREQIRELSRILAVRRGEYDSILAGRSRLIQLFEQHQAQLERAGNTLLTTYRESNIRARSGGAPKRFSKPLILDRVVPAVREPNQGRAELVRMISASQELLASQSEALHGEFESAVTQYRQLDDLVPEATRGQAA